MDSKTKNQLLVAAPIAALAVWYFFFKTEGGDGIDHTGNGTSSGSNGSTGNPNFNAHSVAMDLYDAMVESGTDEDAIVAILTPINAAQFDAVFTAFGSLPYNSLLGNQYQINPFTPLPRVDLKGWLKSELSAAEYANWKRKYPNRL